MAPPANGNGLNGRLLPVVLTALWMVTCASVGFVVSGMTTEIQRLGAAQTQHLTHHPDHAIRTDVETLKVRVAMLEKAIP